MVFSRYSYAGVLALASAAIAQTNTQYKANTNTNCGTASDVDYQGVYYYGPNDLMDWGLYTQSQGSCDAGSYARVHLLDPTGNDIDCGYVALDGNSNLLSCPNYPRAYMPEGQYTIYWETVPGVNQYSWNQFTISHTQVTITGAVPTQTVTTTPVTVLTSSFVSTPTDTQFIPQQTVTSPSATVINTINVTPQPTTITTTSTSWYTISQKKYTQTTTTAYITAPCTRAKITNDFTAKRATGSSSTSNTNTAKTTKLTLLQYLQRLAGMRKRDDSPNTVGMPGLPATSTIVPDAVVSTVTAATSTSIISVTEVASAVTITSTNPTPTLTVFSGVAVKTTTITLPQVTKSILKNKISLTLVTVTQTLTYTKSVRTTPVCSPTKA